MQLFMVILIGINFFYIESMRDPVFCIVMYGIIAGFWLPDAVTGNKESQTQESVSLTT